ncbi:TPA: hypothetical protein ACSB4L_003568 [Acinetobacter baumannii]|uniref:hypothetical protein n=1 Tax=Acinetobacter baumannii TaxID=470 RepID=UPI001CDD0DFA|nr:hypothetical protein [Acinetobacter baumannii]MCA4275617.1 hypothetical protein [Acinetobacter baumannii]
MTDLNKLRSEFEAVTETYHCIYNADLDYYFSGSKFVSDKAEVEVNAGWKAWKKAKAQAVPENTEDWYLDEDEGLWLDHDGIDGTLCELGIGEVKPVKHKEYLITQSNTLYAARVWDSDDDHIAWKLFESEESALEAATYCKQMYEASESGAEK